MAYVMMRHLMQQGDIEVCGVVTTLAPAMDRARLCRGTLDLLGLHHIPVGIGTDGGDTAGVHKKDPFEAGGRSYMPSERSEQAMLLEPARRLLRRVYQEAKPKSLTVLIIASLKDPAIFLRDNEKLFAAKTKEVVIMGGVKKDYSSNFEGKTSEMAKGKFLEPDDAHNQEFDSAASKFLFRRCQELGIPLVIISRWSAYAAKMPRETYDVLALSGSSIGRRLRNAQRGSIEQLWVRACAPLNDPARKGLPPRCDRKWFINTFCGGRDDPARGSEQPVWDLVDGFMQYDTLALLAAVPSIREKYFQPETVITRAQSGTKITNLIIGRSKEDHQLKLPNTGFLNFLSTGYTHGLALNHHFKAQVLLMVHLREDTAADVTLTCLMMRTLYACWAIECIGVVVSVASDNMTPEHVAEQVQTMKKTLVDVGLRFVPVLDESSGKSTQEILVELYKSALPMGVTLVVTGALTAAAHFAENEPSLFREKTTRAVLIGGAIKKATNESRISSGREFSCRSSGSGWDVDDGEARENNCQSLLDAASFLGEVVGAGPSTQASSVGEWLEPDPEAHNNLLDMNSAVVFYAAAQKLSVPLLVLSRRLSHSVQIPRTAFEMLENYGGAVGKSVCEMQQTSINQLWEYSSLPKASPRRGRLPERCDADWFGEIFCSGKRPTSQNDIWEQVDAFNVYGPLALLATLPDVVDRYVKTESIQVRAATHDLVSLQDSTSATDPEGLLNLLLHGFVYGARYNVSEYESPQLRRKLSITLRGGREWTFDPSEDKLWNLLPHKISLRYGNI